MLEAEKKVMKLFEGMGAAHGMDKLTTDIFVIALLEPEPICLDELTKRTKYSLASISNKVRFLERFGVISKSRQPGCKKVFINMEKDMSKIMIDQMKRHQELETKPIIDNLPKLILEFKKQAKTKKDKEKIKILEQYHKNSVKMDKLTEKLIKELQK
jgi:DNA-binding transcriptional regulator GbsR (MarR family)